MILIKKISILCFLISVGLSVSFIFYYAVFPIIIANLYSINKGPIIIDHQNHENNNNSNLAISLYVQGLSFPTSMAFVDNNTLMVLEKNTGNVKVVSHGILQRKPILSLSNIDDQAERGLLGIAVLKENKLSKDQDNIATTNTTSTSSTIINKIDYTYSLASKQQDGLSNSKKLFGLFVSY